MCLILLGWDAHPSYRLVVAANRDEFYGRPASPAAFWGDRPDVLAGRDLKEGGTWLGITRAGRFAAVTNVREPAAYRVGAPSRGHLVGSFLFGKTSPAAYADEIAPAAEFNGFNLLLADLPGDREQGTGDSRRGSGSDEGSSGGSLVWFSNRGDGAHALDAGVFGLSNALLDTPWPKVEMGKADLRAALAGPPDALEARLFESLARRDPARDDVLPQTGVGAERERALSSAFISTPEYGTRCSTVVLVSRDGEVSFTERTFSPNAELSEVRHRFRIEVRK
jgi:uncharacterized protein with NRDE domain